MGFGGGEAQREREGPARGLSISRRRHGDWRLGGALASIFSIGPDKRPPRAAARACRRGALHRRDGRLCRGHPAARDDRGRRPDRRPYRAGDTARDGVSRRLHRRDAAARRLLRCPRPRSHLRGVHGGVRCWIRDHRDRRTMEFCRSAVAGGGPRPAGSRRRRPGAADPCYRRRPLSGQQQDGRARISLWLAGGGQRIRTAVRSYPRCRGSVRGRMAICFLVQRAAGRCMWNRPVSAAPQARAGNQPRADA